MLVSIFGLTVRHQTTVSPQLHSSQQPSHHIMSTPFVNEISKHLRSISDLVARRETHMIKEIDESQKRVKELEEEQAYLKEQARLEEQARLKVQACLKEQARLKIAKYQKRVEELEEEIKRKEVEEKARKEALIDAEQALIDAEQSRFAAVKALIDKEMEDYTSSKKYTLMKSRLRQRMNYG